MVKGWLQITKKKFMDKVRHLNKKLSELEEFRTFDIWETCLSHGVREFDILYDKLKCILEMFLGDKAREFCLRLGEFLCIKESRSTEYPSQIKLESEELADYKKVAALGTADIKTANDMTDGCLLSGFYDTFIEGVKVSYCLSLWRFDKQIYIITDCYGNVDYKLHTRRKYWVKPTGELKDLEKEVRDRTGLLRYLRGKIDKKNEMDANVMNHYMQCAQREKLILEKFLINATEPITWAF